MNMRVMVYCLGILGVFLGISANAQIIYSNYFNSNTREIDIAGTAPTISNGILGGVGNGVWTSTYTNANGSATVYANGIINTNPGCVLLPFVPQSGCVYFMSASVNLPSGMPNWVAMGFTQYATQTNNATGIYSRFTDDPPHGFAWLGARANTSQGVFAGAGTANSMGNATLTPTGSSTMTIVLNTIASHWTVSAFLGGSIVGTNVVGGIQMGTNFTYAVNPTIAFAGIGQTSFAGQSVAGIQWNFWSLSVFQAVTTPMTNTYWVGPSALGTGDGSTSANAASFQNSSFWNLVQSDLQTANVDVNLLSGAYYQGVLGFTNMGNPLHRLTLQSVNLYGPDFTAYIDNLLNIHGSQNIKFYGINFSGPARYWVVQCTPNGLYPSRNLEFSYCRFINLTNAYYGAIGLINGVRDVLVDNCIFTNLTSNNGNHQHMIYASHNIVGVTVTNCLFQDCLADYVRFRDDSEYCAVENCTFISTMSSSAWPFISAELYNVTNSDSAGDEFFGNHFQISSNTFIYDAAGGPGPYSALHFSDDGYSPYSYDCDLTASQAGGLAAGSVTFQQSFLQQSIGINASSIKMFGNVYNSQVAHAIDYSYTWDGIQPNGGWQGTIDISGVPDSTGTQMGSPPVLRNASFDRQGLLWTPVVSSTPNQCLFQTWFCNPAYTDILRVPGLAGTTNALLFDQSKNQSVFQWITSPGVNWTLDFLFSIGSGSSGTGTKFNVDIIHNDTSGSMVSVGVNSQGQFGIFNNGGGFMSLPALGTVSFSANNVYRLRIVGNYSASTPHISIYTSDANNPVLDHKAVNLTDWINGTPVSGQSFPETIAFYNFTAPVVLDQITLVPGLAEGQPVITGTAFQGGNLILSGTNGFGSDYYSLFSTTNLVSGKWILEATNAFEENGAFSITNLVPPGTPEKFYRMQLQ